MIVMRAMVQAADGTMRAKSPGTDVLVEVIERGAEGQISVKFPIVNSNPLASAEYCYIPSEDRIVKLLSVDCGITSFESVEILT